LSDTRSDFDDLAAEPGESGVVNAIIEIAKGRRSKFELDKTSGLFRLDRYLFSSSHYPGDYGFVPQTLAEDDDALDVLVMVNEPTFSGCLIETRVVGMFKMYDRELSDCKLLGVPSRDPLFEGYRDLKDVPSHFLREVEHFFATYKQLEGLQVETEGWVGPEEALAEVHASMERFARSDDGGRRR
jgi:inorganic pyrophosphatase